MIRSLQHAVLCHCVLDFTLLDNDLLLEDLDSVELGRRPFAAQNHASVRAVAEDLQELEVLQRLSKGKSSKLAHNPNPNSSYDLLPAADFPRRRATVGKFLVQIFLLGD
jgi:hypothetical protein